MTMVKTCPSSPIADALDALRERRPLRVEPLRWLRIEALARRVDGQDERVRGLLEARLAALIAAHRWALDESDAGQAGSPASSVSSVSSGSSGSSAGAGAGAPDDRAGRSRPLRALSESLALPYPGDVVDDAADDRSPRAASPTGDGDGDGWANPHELRALRRDRETWIRLSAEGRLRHSLDQVPPQAGPLNSPHLVHRALQLMQASAPVYLQRFVAHVDALLWLERLTAGSNPSEARADLVPPGGRLAPRAPSASTKTGAGTARAARPARVRRAR
ncbi:MAG: DUF2894 domain-containing protein [Burkholderiaceae bacterium]